jgi:hypothetical protein
LACLELEVAPLLSGDLNSASLVDNVFSLTLLQTRKSIENLYDAMSTKERSGLIWGPTQGVKEKLKRDFLDNEFIETFCAYAETHNNARGDFKPLEILLTQKGGQIFLLLMKLYKKYLGVNGVCVFIDEFEDLHLLTLERRQIFVESIRALYDKLSSTLFDPELPSFKMMILCTLSFWNEIKKDTHSQALETRVLPFEIPPLVEDEIIAMAEKLFALYERSGYLKHEIRYDFTRLPSYLIKMAGIEAPLSPRFIISQIIRVIEDPSEYIGYIYSSTA